MSKLQGYFVFLSLLLFLPYSSVKAQNLLQDKYGVIVIDVDSPEFAKLGDIVEVDVKIEYNFPIKFNISTVIWDPSVEDFVSEKDDIVEGNGTKDYTFEIWFPEEMEPGTFTYQVNTLYKFNNSWRHTEESWSKSFTIKIEKKGMNIPGFPLESILVGILLVTTLTYSFKKL